MTGSSSSNKKQHSTNKKKQKATPIASASINENNILDLSSVKRYVPKSIPTSLSESTLKTPKSVLCIIPPEEVWEPIQAIRNKYANVERWPQPHICILYPFIPKEFYDEGLDILRPILSKIKSFQITLSQFHYFDTIQHLTDDGLGTIHLEPDQYAIEQLRELQQAVMKPFPYCNALVRKGRFNPHLSVGVFESGKLKDFMKDFQDSWKSVSFMVKEICIMNRGEDNVSPFEIIHRIPLAE
ncbi:hypothetical protein C9374_008500 [Naegleria lovaniensis]|uniref:2'-5' RNA ligase family protein n=1 Tax=Naegleria lovaniensis TaxID=51637 RepID=A0AA88KFJ0_NAELO|nr:uncharacterized protein C9374_008500 [Naegleria lovaniensis]KAG2378357.1 hypothetical protein C9374_008500 [Naegleria lovaniensis]